MGSSVYVSIWFLDSKQQTDIQQHNNAFSI
jgi:hypothetical protein